MHHKHTHYNKQLILKLFIRKGCFYSLFLFLFLLSKCSQQCIGIHPHLHVDVQPPMLPLLCENEIQRGVLQWASHSALLSFCSLEVASTRGPI